MNEYLITLVFAALPVISNFFGGLLAEVAPSSKRTLGLALHAATGVLLAIASVELIPRVIAAKPPWITLLTLVAGGGFFILTDHLFHRTHQQKRKGNANRNQAAWVIFLSVSVDLFSDGLMIGTSVTIAQHLGLLLALARMIPHLPEGFATVASFRQQKTPRRQRLLLSASFVIPMLIGATLGYWVLRGQPEIFKLAVLAFTTGTLITAVVEEIIPEAHKNQDTYLSTLTFVISFALFTLLSVYFK